MKSNWFALLGSLLAAAALTGSAPLGTMAFAETPPARQNVAENAALQFENLHIDFGDVQEGQQVEVVYPVRNVSDETIRITQIRPSCGCTAATGNPTEIAPGDSTEIKLIFNTTNRLGDQYKSTTINTTDPNQPSYQLTFRGTITTDLQFRERMINFGEVSEGSGATERAVLVSRAEMPVEVERITSNVDSLTAELVGERPNPDNPAETLYDIDVTVSDSATQGNLYTMISVHTNHPEKPIVNLPVRASVVGEVIFQPTQLVAFVTEGGTMERNAILTARNAESLEVTSATVVESGLPIELAVTDMQRPNMKTLEATFTAPEGQRQARGNIRVQMLLDGEREATVTIPATVVVRQVRAQAPAPRPAQPIAPRQGPELPPSQMSN